MKHQSTKTYGHDIGLSACFRQWRAHHSHCRFLHGYALQVRLVFEADELDERNWVVDFGSLKTFKAWLQEMFDHKTLVAHDDPDLPVFERLNAQKLIQLKVVPHVGCEAFAQIVGQAAMDWLVETGQSGRVRLVSCEVREHGANSAIFLP